MNKQRGRQKNRQKGGRDKYSFTNVWILERQINIQTERRKKVVNTLNRPTDKQNYKFILPICQIPLFKINLFSQNTILSVHESISILTLWDLY
jgi:hypothetical protein